MARPVAPSRLRLASDVRPSTYDVHLAPDLEAGTFRGDVRIAVCLGRPACALNRPSNATSQTASPAGTGSAVPNVTV